MDEFVYVDAYGFVVKIVFVFRRRVVCVYDVYFDCCFVVVDKCWLFIDVKYVFVLV